MFASPGLCEEAEELLAAVHAELAPEHLIGAMGEAIVGDGREIEDGPALAVWAARLPGVEVIPFRLVARPLGEGMGVLGWPDAISDAAAGGIGPVIMLADPFSFPADGLLDRAERRAGRPGRGRRPRLRRARAPASTASSPAPTSWRRARSPSPSRRAACARWSRRAACRSARRWSSRPPRARRCSSSPACRR